MIASVAWKLSTVEGRKEYFFFGQDITGTKVTNSKSVLGSSFGEDGFRDNNFSFIYVSNDQAYDKLSGNKD
jgi:hypothetical protein